MGSPGELTGVPGGYAQERYRRGLASWRARVRRPLLLTCGPLLLFGTVVAVVSPAWPQWIAGMACGAAITMWVWARDSPPPEVENWQVGADGERRTAAALLDLEAEGWRVVHDVPAARGNYDHIAVGPGGIFLLETKQPRGIVELDRGGLWLRRRHDREARAPMRGVLSGARRDAARISSDLQARAGIRTWVAPVVVVWADFPAKRADAGGCCVLHGDSLVGWLRVQPRRLDAPEVERLTAALPVLAR